MLLHDLLARADPDQPGLLAEGIEHTFSDLQAEVERIVTAASARTAPGDDRWGEAVCAVVVPRNGAEVTLADLVDHTRGRLGGFKQPRRLVLVDQLPVNAGGKVLKRDLRAQVLAGG